MHSESCFSDTAPDHISGEAIRVENEKITYKNHKTVKMNRFQGSLLKDNDISTEEITNELPASKDDIEQQKIMWDRFLEQTRLSSERENAIEYQPKSETKKSSSVSEVLPENIGSEQRVMKENDLNNNGATTEENSALENIYSTHKSLVEGSKNKRKKLTTQNDSNFIFAKKIFPNRKKKLNVLEESRNDWDRFKKEQGIDEDITSYNKGRAGYLEKQAFLYRCDWRSFEYQKNARISRLKCKMDETNV